MTRASLRETFLYLFVALLLAAEVLLLLDDLRLIKLTLPWHSAQAGQSIGQVVEAGRSLNRRTLGSLTWNPLLTQDLIWLNDSVMTGAKDETRIQLRDGTEVILGPHSFVNFDPTQTETTEQTLHLSIDQGNVRVVAKNEAVVVQLKEKRLTVERQAEVAIKASPTQTRFEVSVEKGSASVEDAAATESMGQIEKGQRVSVGQRELAQIQAQLAFELIAPVDGHRFMSFPSNAQVKLQWKGDPLDSIEWATTKTMEAPSQQTPDPEARETLLELTQPGKIYWRGHRGELTTPIHSFLVMPTAEYELEHPAHLALLKKKKQLFLKWKPIPGAKGYQIEISRSLDFKKLTASKTTRHTRLKLKLRSGRYYWRIVAIHQKWGDWPPSEIRSFTYRPYLKAPKPKGFKLLPKSSRSWWQRLGDLLIPTAVAAEKTKKASFEWEPIDEAQGYRFQIAEDADFKRPLQSVDTDKTQVEVVLPIRETYYWRVAGRDVDGDLGEFSEAQKMNLGELLAMIAKQEEAKRLAKLEAEKKEKEAKEKKRQEKLKKLEKRRERLRLAREKKRQAISDERFRALQGIPFSLYAGPTANYQFQKITSDTISLKSQGLSFNEIQLGAEWGLGIGKTEWLLWYQFEKYDPNRSPIPEIQSSLTHSRYGGRFLWQGRWRLFHTAFLLGLQADRVVRFQRPSSEKIEIAPFWRVSLLAGPRFRRYLSAQSWVQWTFLLELFPIGKQQGAGGWVQCQFGWSRLFGAIAPRFSLSANPRFAKLSEDSQTAITLPIQANVSLFWTW